MPKKSLMSVTLAVLLLSVGCGKKEENKLSAAMAARAAGVANPFQGSAQPAAPGKMPEGHPNVMKLAGESARQMDFSSIVKADGGNTIAELFEGKAELEGKIVKVRGKVVRSNLGIMGRNWLHVRDGTGTPGKDDLTVTTSDHAAVGDVVLVEGILALNRDFGYGHKYDVIIENAKVIVESAQEKAASSQPK